MATNYPQQVFTTNLGLHLIGMDEVIADDFIIIDNAFGALVAGPVLQTNSVNNPLQTKLNLLQGANIVLTPDGFGGVTVTAAGTVSTLFSALASSTNTTAAMVVGTGASLAASGSGIVNATEINGIPITGALTHAGQIPISQPGNTSAFLIMTLTPRYTP